MILKVSYWVDRWYSDERRWYCILPVEHLTKRDAKQNLTRYRRNNPGVQFRLIRNTQEVVE